MWGEPWLPWWPPVLKSALVATFVLIGAGFVGTFPLFFELFTAH